MAVAPNDKLVATGSQDKTIRLFSVPDLVQVSRVGDTLARGTCVACLARARGVRLVAYWVGGMHVRGEAAGRLPGRGVRTHALSANGAKPPFADLWSWLPV